MGDEGALGLKKEVPGRNSMGRRIGKFARSFSLSGSVRTATVLALLCLAAATPGFAGGSAPTPFLTPAQRILLEEILDPTLDFFLSDLVVAPNGLARTAYDGDNCLAYKHANAAEWGYGMLAWIIAAERGKITRSDAVARLNTTLATLETLQANPNESDRGLFYFLYDVFDANGIPLAQPRHWLADARYTPYLPSIDNGILTLAVVISEGWAREHEFTALADRANAFWNSQDYRIFLRTNANGKKALAHLFDPVAEAPGGRDWDIYADEGGAQAWIAYLTNSITLAEFEEITGEQMRREASANGVTVPEAAWFNVMFTWGVRSLGGFPVATRETGIHNRYSDSFAAAVSGQIALANKKGYFYPAMSDLMTQGYVMNYVPPNLNGNQEQEFVHSNPAALAIPLNVGPELDPADLTLILDKLAALKVDTAGYFHNGAEAQPTFGFEVAASPYQNVNTYAGVVGEGGRNVFETLSQIYVAGSLFNALGIDSGGATFCQLARNVDGYDAKVADVLGVLYRLPLRVPQDFPTIQQAIDSAIHGDVVEVVPGVYHENLVIDKGITILGSGGGTETPTDFSDDAIIDGDGNSTRPAVSVSENFVATNVVLDGLTIRNGGQLDGSNILISGGTAWIRRCLITDGNTHRGVGSGGYGGGGSTSREPPMRPLRTTSSNVAMPGPLAAASASWARGR